MDDNLLPCPACGTKSVMLFRDEESNLRWGECDDPDCSMHGPWKETDEDAIAAWNTLPRGHSDALSTIVALQFEAGTQRLLADRYATWVDGLMIGLDEQAQNIDRLRAALTRSGIPVQAQGDPATTPPLRISVSLAREIMEGLKGL